MKADRTEVLLAWKHDQACDQEHHSKHHKQRVAGFFPACIIEHFCWLLGKKEKKNVLLQTQNKIDLYDLHVINMVCFISLNMFHGHAAPFLQQLTRFYFSPRRYTTNSGASPNITEIYREHCSSTLIF